MPGSLECQVFCKQERFADRIINEGDHFYSIVSMPRRREGHSLVVPKLHVRELYELNKSPEAALQVLGECSRLAKVLHLGYGAVVLQKFDPTIEESDEGPQGHLHFHVIPRTSDDELFPALTTASDLTKPDRPEEEIARVLELTQPSS